MKELRPLDIAHKFCRYVLHECTGSRTEFADKLGITPAWVTVYKRKIEGLYKVEINYCRRSQSYFLNENEHYKLPPPI